jgi:hypothetical protein
MQPTKLTKTATATNENIARFMSDDSLDAPRGSKCDGSRLREDVAFSRVHGLSALVLAGGLDRSFFAGSPPLLSSDIDPTIPRVQKIVRTAVFDTIHITGLRDFPRPWRKIGRVA